MSKFATAFPKVDAATGLSYAAKTFAFTDRFIGLSGKPTVEVIAVAASYRESGVDCFALLAADATGSSLMNGPTHPLVRAGGRIP